MGGQLMAAVARDANNQMFPLAMALVESECKDNWRWFLETLTDHIGKPQERGVEHRYCVRHMYANFKLRFKEKHLRDIMWAAARAYVPDKFEEYMRQMQAISPKTYAWLSEILRHLWARHTFSPRAICDLLSNNICECFNHWIKEARNEPVLSMFEMIRRQVMCRFHEKRLWISKVKSRICPRIIEKLEDYKFKIPPNNVQEHPSPTKMWTTNSSTAHNSTLTSNVNPVGKGVGREELRATSVSSIVPVGGRVSARMNRGRREVLKIQTRFGVQLLASQSSSNSAKKSAA
ncbi:hypothetical protein ACH5RR_005907 [Cinchona calisaya]|uniref:MULE transposase domain-containing protein n=1 Tax=Cinchona calisaya TaxID=153742 RepID=A0ABD3AMS6_9GENT